MKKQLIVGMCIILLVAQLVSAIGIRPAKTTIAFDEDRNFSGDLWVIKEEGRSSVFKIYISGEMAEYVQIDTETLTFREDEDSLPIHYEIHLPDEVPPGESTAYIVVEETVETPKSNVVSSKIILKHKIIITGPYPNKYIEVKLNFNEREDTIELVSEVENKGKQDVGNVQTTFYINDKEQEKHVIKTEIIDIKKTENKVLASKIRKDLFDNGEYEVSAVTRYDDQNIEHYKRMVIGKPEIDVTYFNQFFIANEVNKYDMELLNKWNERVENIYVDIAIKKNGEKVDEFRTKSVDIEGLMREQINDYFDGTQRDEGEYTFELIVNFWDSVRMAANVFEVNFLVNEERHNSLTGAAVVGEKDIVGGVLWGLLAVVLSGIVIYLMYRFSKKSRNEDEF
jgi:hypothetical protein